MVECHNYNTTKLGNLLDVMDKVNNKGQQINNSDTILALQDILLLQFINIWNSENWHRETLIVCSHQDLFKYSTVQCADFQVHDPNTLIQLYG